MKHKPRPLFLNILKCMPLAMILVLLIACEKPAGELSDYYFPDTHQIYVYSANDSTGKEYWEIQLDKNQNIETTIYNGNFEVAQQSIEKKYGNGINLEELKLMQQGAFSNVDIESGFVFPYEMIDSSEVLFYRIKWTTPNPEGPDVNYELIRNRRFIGFEERGVLGGSQRCAMFKLDESIISDVDGSIELKLKGIEYYAKDFGLVYRRRSLTEEMQIEQELLEVLTPKAFAEIKF